MSGVFVVMVVPSMTAGGADRRTVRAMTLVTGRAPPAVEVRERPPPTGGRGAKAPWRHRWLRCEGALAPEPRNPRTDAGPLASLVVGVRTAFGRDGWIAWLLTTVLVVLGRGRFLPWGLLLSTAVVAASILYPTISSEACGYWLSGPEHVGGR